MYRIYIYMNINISHNNEVVFVDEQELRGESDVSLESNEQVVPPLQRYVGEAGDEGKGSCTPMREGVGWVFYVRSDPLGGVGWG